MVICVTTKFDASHRLPYYDGKCYNMHGHTWQVEVRMMSTYHPSELQNKTTPDKGMVMDFNTLKQKLGNVIELLDHHNLNDYMDNPTCEELSMWIGVRLKEEFKGIVANVFKVRVKEGDGGWAETDYL